MISAISVQNVTLPHRLHNFTATFTPGTVSALIGGDGAGKTSLLRYLATHSGLPAKQVCYQPSTSGVWRNLSVAENLKFIAHTYRLDAETTKERTEQLLHAADLQRARHVTGNKLSGGMRQKLGVCMAMLPKPDLLLLDEPTTGVDPESRETMWQLIKQAAQEGTTVVLATTYLDEADTSDQVFLLDRGQLLAGGTPSQVCASAPGSILQCPIDASTVLDMSNIRIWRRGETMFQWAPPDDAPATPPPGHMQPATFDLDLATVATLLHNIPDDITPPTPPATADITHPRGVSLVQVERVSKKFGGFTALDGVSMHVASGEIVGLIGSNGAGKSTLIRLMLGLDQPTNGTVTMFDGAPNRRARARIGYVPQSLGLYPALSAQENLDFTTSVFGIPHLDSRFNGSNQPVAHMPLGTQRNLAVECALSHTPELLILDEPTSGMDALSRAMLWKTLRHVASRGIGVLITTHYQQEALQCDRLIALERGRCIT